MLDWFLSCSGIGQVGGLVVVRGLMGRLTAPCLNELDEQDKSERCVMDKHFKDFANKKQHDGGLNEQTSSTSLFCTTNDSVWN